MDLGFKLRYTHPLAGPLESDKARQKRESEKKKKVVDYFCALQGYPLEPPCCSEIPFVGYLRRDEGEML